MSKMWFVAILGLGVGIAIGWGIWGQSAGEFERTAVELEENLARSRDALERADREVTELRERHQEITGIVEATGRELSDAVQRAQSITDLLRAAIAVVERLETVSSGRDSDVAFPAPP